MIHHLQDYPGYFYRWIESLQEWRLFYKPVDGIYSPPVFDHSLQRIQLSLPSGVTQQDLPLLQKKTRAVYLAPVGDSHVEMWVAPYFLHKAIIKIRTFTTRDTGQMSATRNRAIGAGGSNENPSIQRQT